MVGTLKKAKVEPRLDLALRLGAGQERSKVVIWRTILLFMCKLFAFVFINQFILYCFFSSGRYLESVGTSCAEMEGLIACSVSPRILSDHFDEGVNRGSPIRRTDSPSKRKGISALPQTIQVSIGNKISWVFFCY